MTKKIKLLPKLATVFVGALSVTFPCTVLSSCGATNTYKMNYGEHINCLDSNGKDYRELSLVQNAVKVRNDGAAKGDTFDEVAFNTDVKNYVSNPINDTGKMLQKMYFDVVSTYTNMLGSKIDLTWNLEGEGKIKTLKSFVVKTMTDTFNFGKDIAGGTHEDCFFYYTVNKDKSIILQGYNTTTAKWEDIGKSWWWQSIKAA